MFEDRATQQAFYKGFFEELEAIEKNAMLQKESMIGGGRALGLAQTLAKGWDRLAGSGVAKGFKQIAEKGIKPIKEVGGQMAGRFEELTGAGVGKGQAALEALRTGAGTDVGKAVGATAGGLGLAGAGAAGTGFVAGRSGRGRAQPPVPQR